MMEPTFRLTNDGKRIQKELKELEMLMVAVGFPAGGPVKKDKNGKEVSVAEYAAYNDIGTNRAPARPFLKNSAVKYNDDYNRFGAEAIKHIMNGGTAQQALDMLGSFAKGVIKQEITDGAYKENSKSTLKLKTSNKPLIDSNLMHDSVNYEIRKR